MIKKNINKILSFSFMFGLIGISSYAKDVKTDNTPPVISYTEEQIGDREALRVTVTATDESGIREFIDHKGNAIVGNTTTVEFNRRGNSTFTAIDNAGNRSEVTIDLSWVNPLDGFTSQIHERGSSFWISSNLREWLNSDKETVFYTSNPPTDENMSGNGYDSESGFLNEFTEEEKNAIAITERRVMLNQFFSKSIYGGNSNVYPPYNYGAGIVNNYGDNYIKNYKLYRYTASNDKVFLLNQTEIMWYLYRRGDSFYKELTNEAKNKNNLTSNTCNWWIQSNSTWYDYEQLSYVKTDNKEFYLTRDARNRNGIVPAINIKPSYIFEDGRLANNLKIGDIVKFGRYLGESIEWKVINISNSGYPLLLSEKILDVKGFDAKGDYSRMYSDYIEYEGYDVSMMDIEFKTVSGNLDIEPPRLSIVNEELLNTRHNGAFTLDLNVSDESDIAYIKLPNGEIINDSNFQYTFTENKVYFFESEDIYGNFVDFAIPIGNINEEPVLKIESNVGEDWSNNVKIEIRSSNNVKKEIINHSLVQSEEITFNQFPNYISYSNAVFKVKGKVKLVDYSEDAINECIHLGFTYKNKNKNDYGYMLSDSHVSAKKIYISELLNPNNEIDFETEYIIGGNYFSQLRPRWSTSLSPSTSKRFKVEIDCTYEIVDDSDFAINSIILPDGTRVKDVKNYTDTITEDGIHQLRYKVEDNRGKVTEKTITVKVDRTKPILNLEYDYDKFDFLSNKSLVVNVSGSDTLSGFKRIKLPDGNYTSSSNATYTITDYGAHVFECEDIAGNVTRETIVVEDMSVFEDTERLVEVAEQTRNSQDISNARDAVNNLPESSKKDELQDRLNTITNISDITFDKKSATSNIDVYIKSENMLLMSLSTNNITFNDYSGVDDMELNNAINISINSSLPYQLNSYLLSEIENSGKSNRIEKDLLNIKSNIDNNYKTFNDINEKLVLEDDCDAGNNKSHSIDLKLKGSQAHKADIYKTVIKFEAEQK